MDNPTFPLFPVFAFFGFVLVLIPLPWHIQAWNVGTCAYIFWASLACLSEFVNSLVWKNAVSNLAPVWCDISSKFLLGAGVGIPAASLSISRRLYNISAIKSTVVTHQDKCRAVIIDSCIAFGIPVLIMTLHYVVQGHRFDILEDVGCTADIYYTLSAYFLVLIWPTLLGCISFVFSAFTLCAFYKRRLEFSQFLSVHSSLSMSRYIRLMMLAICEMTCTVPISSYSLYVSNVGLPLQPWISWANTHYDFSYVGQVPAAEWMGVPDYHISVELTRWSFVFSAVLFFLLFGFGSEARKNYYAAFLRVAAFLGYKSASGVPAYIAPQYKSAFNKNISVGSLPIYAPTQVKQIDSPIPSATKAFEIDVEKAAGYSSLSLPSDCPQDQQLSPTTTCVEGDTEESAVTVARSTTHSTDCHTIPAYYRPFGLPGVIPAPPRVLHASNSDNVRLTVQTECHSVD